MKHPYKFIAVMVGLLIFALIVVVFVWFRFQQAVLEPAPLPALPGPPLPPATTSEELPAADSAATTPAATEFETAETAASADEPIPAAAVAIPLTPEQQQLAENLGIDPDAITITPALVDCVAATLGAERYAAITGGDTPTFLEGLSMVRCLGQ